MEVPCALASVRAELQPSVWCVRTHVLMCISICGFVCARVDYHRDGTHSKDYRKNKLEAERCEMIA